MTNIQIKKERIKSLLLILIVFYNYAITSTNCAPPAVKAASAI